MSYKSYKQLYRLILNSNHATTKTTVAKTLNTNNINIVQKYFFKLNIELPFTTQAKLSVKSFHSNNTLSDGNEVSDIGCISSPTISQRNTYQSIGTSQGCILLNHNFISNGITNYKNDNYDMDYIDIQNNISWLTDGIELYVNSRILDDTLDDIGGFPEIDSWTLELIIYDSELEQNPDFKPFKPFQNGYAPTYG